jgi:hypothetical protein
MHGTSWANIHEQSIQTSFGVLGYDPKTSVHHLSDPKQDLRQI